MRRIISITLSLIATWPPSSLSVAGVKSAVPRISAIGARDRKYEGRVPARMSAGNPGGKLAQGGPKLTQHERQNVLNLLRDYIHPDNGEAQANRQDLPQQAVATATPESCRAFLEIHEALSRLVDRFHIRTRYTGLQTATRGYGLAYRRDPVRRGSPNTEVQAVLLPTNPDFRGMLEIYFSGHNELPVDTNDAETVDPPRQGFPVFRARFLPTPQLIRQSIDAFRRSGLFPGLRGI